MSNTHSALSSAVESGAAESFRPSSVGSAYGAATRRWSMAAGLLLFALLLWKTQLDQAAELLWNARWAFGLIFIPYTLILVCETVGWRWAFPVGRSVPFLQLLRVTVATKAIQFLTPSIIQAGEFLKVHLLKGSGVNVDVAAASVVVAKTTIMIAEVVFIALGLCVALSYVAIEPAVGVSAAIGLSVMALCILVIVCVQRAGVSRPLLFAGRVIPFLTPFTNRYQAFLCSMERIVQAHLEEKTRFASSCLWFFMGWAAGIVEVWTFLLILGVPADLAAVLFIHVWSLVVTRLTAFIPGNLGAQEVASAMTFSFLGFSVESAMAFAALRRLRQIGWIAVGFGCLTKASRR